MHIFSSVSYTHLDVYKRQIYDNPTIYVDEAASDILEDKGYSLEDAKVVDYDCLLYTSSHRRIFMLCQTI